MRKKSSTGKASKGRTTADNLETRFDEGEDVLDYFDADNAIFRINIDIPRWAVKELDAEAARRGITRQSLIKTWLVDMLDTRKKETAERKAIGV